MIILTGGAGFIGSCFLRRLNEEGYDNILVVDRLTAEKERNLSGKKYRDLADKTTFRHNLNAGRIDMDVQAVVHMGACSSTTLTDEAYYRSNNLEYSQELCEWCLRHGIKFIYASSAATYGDGNHGYRDDEESTLRLRPLNLYGWSKHYFDLWALENRLFDRITGFKFFNVFGPNEYHKGSMRSVLCKKFPDIEKTGMVSLFKSHHPDFADGEQKRDFIYIKDVLEVMVFFLNHPETGGLYNVGTGQANSWNDLVTPVFEYLQLPVKITYIDMPHALREKYQYFTEADVSALRRAGFTREFTPLRRAVIDYCDYLRTTGIY